MQNLRRPTDAEYAILQVLWRHGPRSVREVYDELSRARDIGYTTVLKLLQIMLEKGLVTRYAQGRAHIYTAMFSEEATQQGLVSDLLTRVFGGSARALVVRALEARPTSAEELAEIRGLLDSLDGPGKER